MVATASQPQLFVQDPGSGQGPSTRIPIITMHRNMGGYSEPAGAVAGFHIGSSSCVPWPSTKCGRPIIVPGRPTTSCLLPVTGWFSFGLATSNLPANGRFQPLQAATILLLFRRRFLPLTRSKKRLCIRSAAKICSGCSGCSGLFCPP